MILIGEIQKIANFCIFRFAAGSNFVTIDDDKVMAMRGKPGKAGDGLCREA